MSISYDPQADPLADVLRRAVAGDQQARVEFHAERARRARARVEFDRTARDHAWAMIHRARSGNTGAERAA